MAAAQTLKEQWKTRWEFTAYLAELLKRVLFKKLFEKAIEDDLEPLKENTLKHVKCLYNCVLIIPLTMIAIAYGGEKAVQIILYISLAAQIAGIAWFYISFDAIPTRHNSGAMDITENMFSAFLASTFSIATLAAYQTPLTLLIIIPIYWWLYKSAAGYDSADLLKIGKSEQELKAAQATQRMEKLLEEIRDRLPEKPE